MSNSLFDDVIAGDYIVQKSSSIREVLEKIEFNQSGLAFVLDEESLFGVISDGDIRRGLLSGLSMDTKCEFVANTKYVFGNVSDSDDELKTKFSQNVSLLPLINEHGKFLGVIRPRDKTLIQLAQPNMDLEEIENVMNCMTSNVISSTGSFVKEFESRFSEIVESKRCFAVSNGTQAIALALWAAGIGPGDEVIVPDLTFAATANAVMQVGATPILADVNECDWNIELEQIKMVLTSRTKAIIPVHLYGLPCQMDEIMEFANDRELIVIEDAAEALGAEYRGRKAGSLGHFSAFSFFANKVVTSGEGGMLCVNYECDFDRIYRLRSHGMSTTRKYWHEEWGTNIRLTNLQSAIGLAQLKKLDRFTETKKKIHKRYVELFSSMGLSDDIKYERIESQFVSSSYWLSCFQTSPQHSERLIRYLSNNFVEARPFFYPLHSQPAFARFTKPREWMSEKIHKKGICLPSGTKLTDKEQEKVCELICNYFEKASS